MARGVDKKESAGAGESVTIRSVARKAEVSIATVSRYLNQNGYVGAESADRIRRAMSELSYVPNTTARNLATNKTWTIGLILEHIAGDFFTPLFKGIEAEASEAGYSLMTVSTAPWKGEGSTLPPLGPHNTDGVLVFADGLPDSVASQWASSGFPMVFIQQEPPRGCSCPSVQIENSEAVKEAVLHLVRAHGRKRIVFMRGQRGQKDSGEREAGYRAALAEAGIEARPELFLEGDFDTDVAYGSMSAALDAGLSFDAVCAADDDSAIGALRALRERGLRVPEEVSLFGFDDQQYCRLIDPQLSTIRAPTEAVARKATRALLALLRSEEPEARAVLPSEVICRRSCGCSKS